MNDEKHSSPREILDERLALGEIDSKEHSRLVDLLQSVAIAGDTNDPALAETLETRHQSDTVVSPDRSVTATLPEQSHAWLWWLFGGIGIFIILAIIGMSNVNTEASDLTIGQLNHDYGKISLTLANSSSKSGDVVLYASYDGIQKCEHVIKMKPGRIDNLKFKCGMPASQRFNVHARWASESPQVAAIAKRIAVDWNNN